MPANPNANRCACGQTLKPRFTECEACKPAPLFPDLRAESKFVRRLFDAISECVSNATLVLLEDAGLDVDSLDEEAVDVLTDRLFALATTGAEPTEDKPANKRTVQAAVEAIGNDHGDGWDPACVALVRADALRHGVASLYVDLLPQDPR